MENSNITARLEHQLEIENAEVKLRSLKLRRWLKLREVALYLGEKYETIKKRKQRGKFLAPNFMGGAEYWDREKLDLLIENSSKGSQLAIHIPYERRRKRWR